jgi:hypothetical protein
MTDDLMKRLRGSKGDIYQMVCMMSEAADRIEQLEAALRDIACTCSTGCGGQHSECRARAALGEKKDG